MTELGFGLDFDPERERLRLEWRNRLYLILHERGLSRDHAMDLICNVDDRMEHQIWLWSKEGRNLPEKAPRPAKADWRSEPRAKRVGARSVLWGAILREWQDAGLALTGHDAREGRRADFAEFLCVFARLDPFYGPATENEARKFVAQWKRSKRTDSASIGT